MAHIEREIKLDLPPRAFARLAKLAPQHRSVASVYFDTAGEELRRAGMALRLRRDGRRWLQTLKADGAPHAGLAQRTEWELPVRGRALEPRAFPCAEIRALTGIDLEKLAGRLKPVFETRFTRRSGLVPLGKAGKAELAIDRGTILASGRREPISEVEVELVSGDASELLRFAQQLDLPLAYESKAERGYRLAQGGSPAPRKWRTPPTDPAGAPGAAFAELFAVALMQVGTNAAGLLGSRDPEYLHQMRVGMRRLRAVVHAFKPLLDSARRPKRAPRRLWPALGMARDWDVFVALMESLEAQPRMLRIARSKRDGARRAAVARVASAKFRSFLFRWLRWLESKPWSDGEATLADFARMRLEKLHRRSVRKVDLGRAKTRHELRVRIKRLRYACELFAPCFAQQASLRYLDSLRALQDLLGRLNDLAVARRLLESIDAAVPPALERREKRLIASVAPAWARFLEAAPFWRRTAGSSS